MPGTTAATPAPSLVDLVEARIVTPAAIAKTALRYEYLGAEETLAHTASSGRMPYAEVLELARAHAAGDTTPSDALDGLSSASLYALAFLSVGAADDERAIFTAADLFALARTVAERTGASTEHPDIDIQASMVAGRHEYVRRHLPASGADPWVRWAAAADLLNPFSAGKPSDRSAWQAVFDRPFLERGLAPVRVGDASDPFDTLTTEAGAAPPRTVDGPLVTIIVSVFKPTASLVTAVRSLVEQTWRNLQVIIVDDASPEEFAPMFARATALDDRVEYVRMPVNGGAYKARNHGVGLARGELVGFQDGDDWSHPQRIERQVAAMADPSVVATLSKAVRLHSDLLITKPGSLPFEKNSPSLLMRRELVLDRLGRFDAMRKAADTEFIERLVAVYGSPAVVTLEEPLSLYQLTHGSLSRGDFRVGWHREARVSYHSALRHWHRRIINDGADPVIVSATGRSFPAPPEIEGTEHPAAVDVVLLADFRYGVVESTGLPAEVAALAASGLDVGLARGEALRLARANRDYPQPLIQRAVALGQAMWRPLSADIAPRLLLVRDPDLLALPRKPANLRMHPDRVVLVADRLPSPDGEPRVAYDPVHVERVGRQMFDLEVEWLPASPDVAAALTAAGASGTVHPPRLLEVADVSRHPSRLVTGRPVIVVSDASKFGAERLDRRGLMSLPRGGSYDVRLLESSERPRRYPDPRWLAFDPYTLTPTELFDQCDFFVGLAPRVHGTRLVRPVIDAMARGCVPIVDPVHRPVLGDAAVYLGDRSVQQLVDELWSDPDRYARAQLAALAFCHNECSPEAFASTIAHLAGTKART